ncbi:hypothetical protein GGI23_002365 [Coemansia sp. RSA 2559]|nr:hypothetical protein GGI23_002365 [Coemansia sp. RSA 2559]
MLGDTLAFTSVNLLVANIAPTKADLGFVNGLQQQVAMSAYIVGTLVSGYLWSWSIKHSFPYPFNSHFAWVFGGVALVISWYITLKLPDSVNIFASGSSEQSRADSGSDSGDDGESA